MRNCFQLSLLAALLLALPVTTQAQFRYTVSNGYATIMGPSGNPTTLSLPSTVGGYPVIAIAAQAFENCSSLTSVTIPSTVSSIGFQAFAQCSHLTYISVNGGNSTFSSVNGVLYNKSGTQLIQYPGGLTGSYPIPNGVTGIGTYAFGWCSHLTGVTASGSVVSIGDQAFYNCTGLTNFMIPSSLAAMGNSVFNGCSGLVAIQVDGANTNFSSSGGVMFNKNGTQIIAYPNGLAGSYTIPNTVTNIADNAFYSCQGLSQVTIPRSVTSIGNYAFCVCFGLTNVYFQGNAPTTNSTAFFEDTLTYYYLPGTTGWASFPTNISYTTLTPVLWSPQAQTADGSFGIRTNQFGFNITGNNNLIVVVEASTDLVNWQPLATNTLTGNPVYFSDAQWTNYPGRIYRLRSP